MERKTSTQLKIRCMSCMIKMSCSLTQTHIKLTVFAFQKNAAGGGGLAFGEFMGWKWKLHVQNTVETVSESSYFSNTIMVFNPTMCPFREAKSPTGVKVLPPALQPTSAFWLKPDTQQCFLSNGQLLICLRIKIIIVIINDFFSKEHF